jgi:hypothetical protein
MKLNHDALKEITLEQVKAAIAEVNSDATIHKSGEKILGKRHANKTILAECLVDGVLRLADKGFKIPEGTDALVGKLTTTDHQPVQSAVEKPQTSKSEKTKTSYSNTVASDEPKPSRRKITADMTIVVIEELAPKRPGTCAIKLFELFRKHKTVAEFLKNAEWPRPRAALAYERHHGRIVLEK